MISIIINCHNGEEFLEETLASIVNQTYKDWELIFWDNNSTDNSRYIYNKFKDKRFRYYRTIQTTTLAVARNSAVDKAKGEWIGFCDCDDIWVSNKLELQNSIITNNSKVSLVYGKSDFILINNKSKEWDKWINKNKNLTLPKKENIFYDLIHRNFIFWGSVLIKKNVFINVGKINPKFNQAEDFDIILKIAKHNLILHTNETIFLYRIHSNNLTHKQRDLDFQEVNEILSEYLPDIKVLLAIYLRRLKYSYLKLLNFDLIGFFKIITNRF